MDVLATLRDQFAHALAPLTPRARELAELVRPAQDGKFGDYQANVAMPLGKELGKPPRQVAEQVIANLPDRERFKDMSIAGPGFINLALANEFLAAALAGLADDPHAGVPQPAEEQRKLMIIDFSGPNVAKPMHVGHLRSTVIGDALVRMHRALGWRVLGDNHLGDWGTQFGMIIHGWRHDRDDAAFAADPVDELARLYKLANKRIKEEQGPDEDHPAPSPTADAARAETAKLHAGDAANLGLWQQFMPHCRRMLDEVYERLGVTFDLQLGESFFQPMLAGVVEDLKATGVAEESRGALCVFFPDPSGKTDAEGNPAPLMPPFIVRKKDGAYTYATTDVACLRHRMDEYRPDAITYVVDERQGLHFQQVFATGRKWGVVGGEGSAVELRHAGFGTVLGANGKPLKTRETDSAGGGKMGLVGLLDEAVERARRVVEELQAAEPEADRLPPEEREAIADAVGHGAVKYADLSQNRTTDYKFDVDKMTALDGNTAPYLMMAYARNRSICRKADVDPATIRPDPATLLGEHPSERALAVTLLRYPESLRQAAAEMRPNLLCNYLYGLATDYSAFFRDCKVLTAPTERLKQSRLYLCQCTAVVLKHGLGLLGIATVERM